MAMSQVERVAPIRTAPRTPKKPYTSHLFPTPRQLQVSRREGNLRLVSDDLKARKGGRLAVFLLLSEDVAHQKSHSGQKAERHLKVLPVVQVQSQKFAVVAGEL